MTDKEGLDEIETKLSRETIKPVALCLEQGVACLEVSSGGLGALPCDLVIAAFMAPLLDRL